MAFVVGSGDGERLGGSFDVVVKVRSEQTAGAMAVLEETLQPGALITPHTHQNDVWVFVLTGEIGVLVGDERSVAPAGAWALKPRNVLHSMWNSGDVPARIIEVLTPGGTEQWFEEIAALAPDDADGFDASCERHGLRFYPESPWHVLFRDEFGQ